MADYDEDFEEVNDSCTDNDNNYEDDLEDQTGEIAQTASYLPAVKSQASAPQDEQDYSPAAAAPSPQPLQKSPQKAAPQKISETIMPSHLKYELLSLGSQLDMGYHDIDNFTEVECREFFNTVRREIDELKYNAASGGGGGGGGRGDMGQTGATSSFTNNSNNKHSKKEKAILTQSKNLEEEFKISLNSMEDMAYLREKNGTLMKNNKKEKQQRIILEQFIESQNKKIQILVEHIEKLMKAIKVESQKRAKGLESNRLMQKQQQTLKERLDRQMVAINTQQRFIAEISEGSKILEDQLKLMDEKYLNMRSKMDVAREYFQTQIGKVKKESETLRMKYSFAHKGNLLDLVRVPVEYVNTYNTNSNGQNNNKGVFTSTLPKSGSVDGDNMFAQTGESYFMSPVDTQQQQQQLTPNALNNSRANTAPGKIRPKSSSHASGAHGKSSSSGQSGEFNMDHLVRKIERKNERKKSVWSVQQLQDLTKPI